MPSALCMYTYSSAELRKVGIVKEKSNGLEVNDNLNLELGASETLWWSQCVSFASLTLACEFITTVAEVNFYTSAAY